jgi:hypothetical protein
VDDNIRFVVPIMLDKVSIQLGPWSGYHLLAQHPITEEQEVLKDILSSLCYNPSEGNRANDTASRCTPVLLLQQ